MKVLPSESFSFTSLQDFQMRLDIKNLSNQKIKNYQQKLIYPIII